MKDNFKLFQETFIKYQKLFGLTGYKIYFKQEEIDRSFADITVEQVDMIATVRLNNKVPDKDKPFQNTKLSAKHEAIHLLLHRMDSLAHNRYIREEEVYEAEEELAFKLEELIPD